MSQIISSTSNPLIRRVRDIREGKNREFIFAEGLKLIEEAIKSRLIVKTMICRTASEIEARRLLLKQQQHPPSFFMVTEKVMRTLSDLTTPPGMIALIKRPSMTREATPAQTDRRSLTLILHQLQLPQNVGAVLRTAEAAGVGHVWLTGASVDPFGPKVLRGSMGSVFRLSVQTYNSIIEAKKSLTTKGVCWVMADQNGTTSYDQYDWTQPTALVLGSEGAGFTAEEKALFNESIRIPMEGDVESLNVGSVAAVCLFEAARQKRLKT
ncbi:MAG: RNA methyltransferase [Elusimicrobia bacterium]|nr:RNA methyltransferase [Candidatus Obscuribacterium magneticum]